MPKKLSIAFVCDPIGINKAGVIVSTIRFGKLLSERGHNIIFIGSKSKESPDHGRFEGIKTYRYRSVPIPKSGGWRTSFPTVSELKKVFQEEQIDIVHIALPMSGAIVAIKAAKALGIKIVAHSHSQPENLFMDMPKLIRPGLHRLWNKYLAWIYGKASVLIYPSEMARTLLDKLGDKEQQSIVISNGINLKDFQPMATGDFHERFSIPKDTVNLLFVGRLFPEKSVDTLLKAVPHIIKEHPKTHIMIAGGGHLRGKLEKLVESLGVGQHTTFLGLISEEDKVLAYNASDIFVLPSVAELEGIVVLEAMACGKPIIVSDAEMSASRHFVDGNGLLFNVGIHEDLAEKARKIIADPELRARMSAASLKKIKNYDIQTSIDLLEKIYLTVLKT